MTVQKKKPTYMTLPPKVKTLARVAAALKGTSVTEYVTQLIEADCRESGVADMAEEMEATDE
jgi:hypothetical protein